MPRAWHEASQVELEYLASAGLPIAGDADAPGVRAECLSVARHMAVRRIIGMIPVDDSCAVPPIAIQLGIALMDLSGATVAYVDANTRWPALPVDAARRLDSELADTPFMMRWLFRSLALLVPRGTSTAGDAVPKLRAALRESADLFRYVLVDLTGFERLGERAAALDLVDGVIAVAHRKTTRERDILAVRDELDPQLLIGAVLVG